MTDIFFFKDLVRLGDFISGLTIPTRKYDFTSERKSKNLIIAKLEFDQHWNIVLISEELAMNERKKVISTVCGEWTRVYGQSGIGNCELKTVKSLKLKFYKMVPDICSKGKCVNWKQTHILFSRDIFRPRSQVYK